MIAPEEQLAALVSTRLEQLLGGFLTPQTVHDIIRALEPDVAKWAREILDDARQGKH